MVVVFQVLHKVLHRIAGICCFYLKIARDIFGDIFSAGSLVCFMMMALFPYDFLLLFRLLFVIFRSSTRHIPGEQEVDNLPSSQKHKGLPLFPPAFKVQGCFET